MFLKITDGIGWATCDGQVYTWEYLRGKNWFHEPLELLQHPSVSSSVSKTQELSPSAYLSPCFALTSFWYFADLLISSSSLLFVAIILCLSISLAIFQFRFISFKYSFDGSTSSSIYTQSSLLGDLSSSMIKSYSSNSLKSLPLTGWKVKHVPGPFWNFDGPTFFLFFGILREALSLGIQFES